MDSANLTDRQARMMVDHFMHYVGPAERGRLMRELPEAYNAYVGRPVVVVKIVGSDGERVA